MKLPKVTLLKSSYDLIDPEEEQIKKERNKPSVERKKTPNEKKYNEFVKKLYKQKRFK
tara:strand:+ start:3010 stop:3183 length:174 start_codon:yes stop_codon:yes gene_type:complete